MIVIDEKFLVIKEINGYLVDMILINSFRVALSLGYVGYVLQMLDQPHYIKQQNIVEIHSSSSRKSPDPNDILQSVGLYSYKYKRGTKVSSSVIRKRPFITSFLNIFSCQNEREKVQGGGSCRPLSEST
jgi:hypothetical protein